MDGTSRSARQKSCCCCCCCCLCHTTPFRPHFSIADASKACSSLLRDLLSCNLVHLAATIAKKKKRTSSIDAARNDAACVIPEAARHSDFYLFFVRSDAL